MNSRVKRKLRVLAEANVNGKLTEDGTAKVNAMLDSKVKNKSANKNQISYFEKACAKVLKYNLANLDWT